MMAKASTRVVFALIFTMGLALTGCQPGVEGIPQAEAVAVLIPLSGSQVQGVVSFAKVSEGVRVRGNISNLSPGLHGFHIHEFGDCRTSDGASAGGHFNPRDQIHGAPDAAQHHVGDLGNIRADEKGNARVDFVAAALSLEGDESIIGRSVMVHERQDDFRTQPDGDTGMRLACGVIGIAKR
jgi:superoxide dismutase, Cu-Zn family